MNELADYLAANPRVCMELFKRRTIRVITDSDGCRHPRACRQCYKRIFKHFYPEIKPQHYYD